MIRDDIKAATITAMKAKDKQRTAALRQIAAKIKDRDIELRTGSSETPDDEIVVAVLQKMAKQRRESIDMYVEGNREELAEAEREELAVIEEFLPRMMSEDETKAAIADVKASVDAKGVKDIGKIMAELKRRHGSEMDMSRASALVKGSI